MNNQNYKFFEEFKRLDKLCGQIYKTQYGITHYIDDMKSKVFSNYRHIPNWDSDLKQLIRLRHIRNKMAHEEDAFNNEGCTQNDIDWVKEFYKRIINRSDPLALLHKKSGSANQKPKVVNQMCERQSRCQTITKPRKAKGMVFFLIVLIIIAVAVCIMGTVSLLK